MKTLLEFLFADILDFLIEQRCRLLLDQVIIVHKDFNKDKVKLERSLTALARQSSSFKIKVSELEDLKEKDHEKLVNVINDNMMNRIRIDKLEKKEV